MMQYLPLLYTVERWKFLQHQIQSNSGFLLVTKILMYDATSIYIRFSSLRNAIQSALIP